MNDNLQQQLIKDLLVESFDGLDRFDREMLALEKSEGSADTLNNVFRIIHTIKGSSGCIGLTKIESVAHVGENLLSLLRDGKISATSGLINALLEYSDALKSMLQCLEKTGSQGETDYSALLQRLQSLQTGSPTPTPPPAAYGLFDEDLPPPAPGKSRGTAPAAAAEKKMENEPAIKHAANAPDSAIRVDVTQLDKLMNLVGELVLARNQIVQFTSQAQEPTLLNAAQRLNIITTELQESVMKTRMQPIGNVWAKFPRIVRDLAHELGKQVQLVMEGNETELDRTIIEAIKDPLTHIVRNSVDHGIEPPDVRRGARKPEQGLLILRAFHEGGQVNIEIVDDGRGIDIARVKEKAMQRGLITAEQAARMTNHEAFSLVFQPGFSTVEKITNVSGRGVGMDVVKTNIEKIGGSVDISSELGQGTTLKIKIPLTLAIIPALIVGDDGDRFAIPQVSLLELVRLESEDVRKQIESIHGAPVYRLRGRLLPLVYLKKVLAGNGDLQGREAANQPNRATDTGQIFGRARDAHRDWLQKLRGFLDGSVTLTVDEARSHQQCQLGKWLYSDGLKKYGDIAEIRELEKSHEQFHLIAREIVIRRNNERQANCDKELGALEVLSEKVIELLLDAEKRILDSHNVNIVVLHADGRQFGLVVDQINDTEEIVVKPLGKQLKGLSCFAGATIMGDGKVALILDVLGLAQNADVISEVRDRALLEKTEAAGRADERQTLLLFNAGDDTRLAIPLSMVARLEEFPRSRIERSGSQEVVQYRGRILPLIDLAKYLPNSGTANGACDNMQVVVYSEQGRSVGLVVGRINDIVQQAITVNRQGGRDGILGSAVIQDRVTDLLDVAGIIRKADPTFYSESKTNPSRS